MSTSLQLGFEQTSNPTESEDIKDVKRNLTDMTKENSCLALACQTYISEELHIVVSWFSIGNIEGEKAKKRCRSK